VFGGNLGLEQVYRDGSDLSHKGEGGVKSRRIERAICVVYVLQSVHDDLDEQKRGCFGPDLAMRWARHWGHEPLL
jgi:hypothetical protein